MLLREDFAGYTPQAKQFAEEHLSTLQALPQVFAALLLSQIIRYDWQFPAERAELEGQMEWLRKSDTDEFHQIMGSFAALSLSPELKQYPWAKQPVQFVEKLTAWFWYSGTIDAFHAAAAKYGSVLERIWKNEPQTAPRLCIVVIGQGAQAGQVLLFEQLKQHGTYFSQVDPRDGLKHVMDAVSAEAAAKSTPYAHWYVDGGEADGKMQARGVTTLSYSALAPVRLGVLHTMEAARASGSTPGPEEMRSMLAKMGPGQFGSAQAEGDVVMKHFALSLFTDGSGTQIFSTTFVQWAGREILRRARPQTLLLRYAPRQVDRPMNDMLRANQEGALEVDPAGSLVDGNMGAYYTWINLTRLNGASSARFLAWFEGQREAIAIAPGLAKGTVSSQNCDLSTILRWMS
jgi:hypothetical protein